MFQLKTEKLLKENLRRTGELDPIAHTFNFKIVYPSRFKAVPSVLREMRKGLR